MSKKFEKTNVESVYINVKGFELRKKLNSTNTSYEEFKKELDKIGSKSYENRDVRQLFYNKTDNLDKDNRKRIRDDELKNLQFYHFIPAFIANFLVYYLFSGIVLTGWRDFKSDVEKLSEHKHFFLSNLFLSAIAATLINFTIMAIGSETGIINSFNPKYLILGSLLWIPIFGAVANEIRKKTKYAWLVTGITLNIIIVAIRFDHQSIYTDILIDEIPFYLTVLGIISQYGLFHGEKHLRKMIIRNPTSQ